jgi:peptidoglycan/LPS O-acetylase OafA/YrhL
MVTLRIQNPSPLPANGRLRELDELKGWAMLLVILYHSGGVLGWNNWLHGEIGVDVFVMVSGFALARSSSGLSGRQFLRRRLIRIFPAYWVALAFFLFLSHQLYGVVRPWDNIVLHVLGLHAFAFTQGVYFSDINDSFWFISLILLLYAAFLGIRSHLSDIARVLGLGLLLTTVLAVAYIKADHAGGLSHLAVRVPDFFLGLAAGRVSQAPATEFRFEPCLLLGIVAMTILGWMTGVFPFGLLAAPAATIVFFAVRARLKKHPDGRFVLAGLALMGVYSYEIFLFHQPLIRDYNALVWNRYILGAAPSRGQLALGIVVALGVTFLLSFAVHHAIARLFARRPSHSASSA